MRWSSAGRYSRGSGLEDSAFLSAGGPGTLGGDAAGGVASDLSMRVVDPPSVDAGVDSILFSLVAPSKVVGTGGTEQVELSCARVNFALARSFYPW